MIHLILQSHNGEHKEDCNKADNRHAHRRVSRAHRVGAISVTARVDVVRDVVRFRRNSQSRPIEVASIVVIDKEEIGRASPVLRAVLNSEMRAAIYGVVRVRGVQLDDIGHQDVS